MRIRSIKPEFWSSEDIARLSWADRLLFIGLWSYVDDNGVGRDNEKLIMADLFPLEDNPRDTLASVSRGLQALCDGGQIDRYTVDGRPFLFINAWASHQRIDRPNKARYPVPTCGNAIPRDTLATPSRVSRETPLLGAVEQGSRGAVEQGSRGTSFVGKPTDIDRFPEFWDTYNRKVAKPKAEAAYRAALKKPGVTEELLIHAAREYVTWERANNEGGRFIKHPTTWLHGECWMDERSTVRPMSRSEQWLDAARDLHEQRNGEIA